jgi:anaerobic nitric oxide reductase transcription regulator
VLQNGQLQRIGSDAEHRVDVRVIAATNRDLIEEVRTRRYRADFYHRLSVYPLAVPPLRSRGRDVLLIAGFFLEENRARLGLSTLRLSADAQAALLAYRWPGNIRELEHLISRSAMRALASHRERPRILTLSAQDLGLATAEDLPRRDAAEDQAAPDELAGGFRGAVTGFERRLVSETLVRHNNNLASAARELGIDRANLGRLARRLGVK